MYFYSIDLAIVQILSPLHFQFLPVTQAALLKRVPPLAVGIGEKRSNRIVCHFCHVSTYRKNDTTLDAATHLGDSALLGRRPLRSATTHGRQRAVAYQCAAA